MREENRAVAVDQEIAAGLVNIAFTIILAHQSFAKQFQVQFQRRRRKNPEPGKPFQVRTLDRPCAPDRQESGRATGDAPDSRASIGRLANEITTIETPRRSNSILECVHLDEVSLTGQSGQMTEKDQQQLLAKESVQRSAVSREDRESASGRWRLFPCGDNQGVFKRRYALVQCRNIESAITTFEQTKRGAPT